jgi:hypothetical protein
MAPTTLADPVSAELRSILRALKLGKNKTLTAPVPKPYQLYRRGSELVRLGDPQGHRRPPRRSEELVAARLCPAGPTCRAGFGTGEDQPAGYLVVAQQPPLVKGHRDLLAGGQLISLWVDSGGGPQQLLLAVPIAEP